MAQLFSSIHELTGALTQGNIDTLGWAPADKEESGERSRQSRLTHDPGHPHSPVPSQAFEGNRNDKELKPTSGAPSDKTPGFILTKK